MTSDLNGIMVQEQRQRPWWRELGPLLIIVLVGLAYWVRIGDVSMRGEEPTRAHVAFAMVDTGDWVVPRVQGEPFLSRPPLQNWLIALASITCGSRDAWAVRLPSALAMLATSLLIYGYARHFLAPAARWPPPLFFRRLAKCSQRDVRPRRTWSSPFSSSASFLLWHWGVIARWPAWRTWVLSYICVALAILCKGPQPPVYFLGAVGAYLVINRQWRQLFSWSHLLGLAVASCIVLGWAIPCIGQIGLPETWGILMNDSTMRFRNWEPRKVGLHLLSFPAEVFACTLPWSFLLSGYISHEFARG